MLCLLQFDFHLLVLDDQRFNLLVGHALAAQSLVLSLKRLKSNHQFRRSLLQKSAQVLNLRLQLLDQRSIPCVYMVFVKLLGNHGCSLGELNRAHRLFDAGFKRGKGCNQQSFAVASDRVLKEPR